MGGIGGTSSAKLVLRAILATSVLPSCGDSGSDPTEAQGGSGGATGAQTIAVSSSSSTTSSMPTTASTSAMSSSGGGGEGSGGSPCDGIADGNAAAEEYQAAGDCNTLLCINGQLSTVVDDLDVPSDPDPTDCEEPGCTQGSVTAFSLAALTPCSYGGGTKCDGTGSCVSCVDSSDCVGHPDGEACIGGHCGCSDVSPCPPTAGCATSSCVANLCVVDVFPQGTTTPSCFPFACDGTSPSCPLQCLTDADCAGQSCVDGSCTPSASCDLEWYEPLIGVPCQPFSNYTGGLLGIDWNADISITTSHWNGTYLGRQAARYGSDGQLALQTPNIGGLHTQCTNILGPFGALGSNCSYSFQTMRQCRSSTMIQRGDLASWLRDFRRSLPAERISTVWRTFSGLRPRATALVG